MEIEFTDQNFAEYTSQNKPMLIDFYADWCGPCRYLAPTVEALAQKYEGKAIVGKCNVDENEELTSRFGIRNIPAVFFLVGDEVKDKSIGAVPANVLEEKLNAIL
jgi:thioredoxin 1